MKQLSDEKIVVGLEKLDLSKFPNLKVVGCNMTSCEHLPLKEMEEKGITLISLKDFPIFLSKIYSTAEHTIGLILTLLRNYKTALNYPYKEREFYQGHTLNGKTLGIIGYGRIGKQVKQIAESFGMKVITFDCLEGISHRFLVGDLDNLLKESDIITIHIPLSGNEGFFTKDMFKKMKPTAYLINTSRDGVIEKGALIWALENGKISGAGIDFIDDEDLVVFSKTHNNLILTPHIGGNTYEDREKTEQFIINQINNYEI